MSGFGGSIRRMFRRGERSAPARSPADLGPLGDPAEAEPPGIDIAPNDPAVAFFQSASGAVDLDELELESPALDALRAANVKLVVPLVSQGELIGLLNLGPRLSEQAYSSDDRRLLDNLAAQAAPAVRVGQLVREQESEVRERERIEQELRVAQLIQQSFLPRELPTLDGWSLSAYYRPAREVGGDFYDVIELDGGRVGIVVGDVTDKGVPAAMVMASARSVLRAAAHRLSSPGAVLAQVNESLCPDIPAQMFVTCFYAILDPASGALRYANAGHNLPVVRRPDATEELRATGMPLGLMPGMDYEERDTALGPGDCVLFHSDGVVEAHGPDREMFGASRLAGSAARGLSGQQVIDRLLSELGRFTGPGWEQEDDITLVALERAAVRAGPSSNGSPLLLGEFSIASEQGNEREVMRRVVEAVGALALEGKRLEQVKTAVSEAAMNAIEHGNAGRSDLEVGVRVSAERNELRIRIADHALAALPVDRPAPDLEAKLAGEQTTRGWGLFLIEQMVDRFEETSADGTHAVELVFRLDSGKERA